MLINPGFLFPEISGRQWCYVGGFTEFRPVYVVQCGCENKPCFEAEILLTVIKLRSIELIAESFRKDQQVTTIWYGHCPNCHRTFWTCFEFCWVTWLTDLQTLTMVLKAVPINHYVNEQSALTHRIQFHKGTWITFDGKSGKVIRSG